MATVEREGRYVTLYAAEEYGSDSEKLYPAEAREVARELVEAADALDAELAAARAVCERDGHQWEGYNATRGPFGPKIYVEWCTRGSCDVRRETGGWREVAR